MKRFQRLYTIIFSLCLIAFSAYALLDTFAISRVYATVEQPGSVSTPAAEQQELSSRHYQTKSGQGRKKTEENTGTATAVSAPSPDTTGYSSDAVQISLTEYYEYDSSIYVADIILEDISSLKTAFSQSSYGRNVTARTSETAARVGAVLAVNGDNYGSREKGYVIRNGVLYRSAAARDQEDLVIYADGSFEIIREEEITAQQLLKNGAVQVFSFGPGLIEDGSITVSSDDEVDRAKASNPRTAIGIIDSNHYVLVVSDGRTARSEGLRLYELAEFMQKLGVQTAYNLDGGGSSTMVYQGTVINEPTSGGTIKERAVTDIIYFS